MSKSSNYWRKREREWKKADLKDEAEYIQEIQDIYSTMLTQINKEIESFFIRYSNKGGMSMAEAKRKASDIDIKEYEKKAKKYVKEKDFSKEANEQMRLYNLAMKVNRLELLKANIGLELTAGSDELVSFTKEKLEGAALEQIQRNAGILGDTIVDNAKTAKTIANSSFKNATFSERIWSQQDLLKNDLYGILSTALIQGRNPREFIPKVRKSFDVTRYQAERLLRTELTRVRIQAQAESYEANGIDEYEYVACGLKDVCPLCKVLDKQIFKLKDMEPGENAPPMHPNCHCSTAPHSDRNAYEKWLNGLANGDYDLRFDEWKALNDQEKERIRIPDTGKNVPGHVDSKLANSKKMHDKFENLTGHKSVDEALYSNSLQLLYDNNDTEFEHLIAIDARSGEFLVKNMDSAKAGVKHQCGFSKPEESDLNARESHYEALHNHPNSSIPSRDDIKKLFEREYQSASTIICHDITVYRLERLKDYKEVASFIDKVYHEIKVEYIDFDTEKIEYECSVKLIDILTRGGYMKYVKR